MNKIIGNANCSGIEIDIIKQKCGQVHTYLATKKGCPNIKMGYVEFKFFKPSQDNLEFKTSENRIPNQSIIWVEKCFSFTKGIGVGTALMQAIYERTCKPKENDLDQCKGRIELCSSGPHNRDFYLKLKMSSRNPDSKVTQTMYFDEKARSYWNEKVKTSPVLFKTKSWLKES